MSEKSKEAYVPEEHCLNFEVVYTSLLFTIISWEQYIRHKNIMEILLDFSKETGLELDINQNTYKYDVSGYYPSSCFYLKHSPVYVSKHKVSETGICLRLQEKTTQLGPIDRASPYLRQVRAGEWPVSTVGLDMMTMKAFPGFSRNRTSALHPAATLLPIRLQLIDDRSMKFALRQPIFK
jgi:hypothetical protein